MTSARTLSSTSKFVIARITPIGTVYTNAEGRNFNRRKYNQECPPDVQMMRANTKAHTGSSVFHTSIVMTLNANIITEKGVRIQAHLRLMIDARTEDGEIPPIGDFLVYGHQTSVDIGLI
jgi:hypothetical protein